MPGNSQRKGAVRKKGKGQAAGSGGRIRRGLEGRGPTPKAEDRVYHAAHERKQVSSRKPSGRSAPRPERARNDRAGAPEWVAGRNPVLEALQAEVPAKAVYVAEGAERDTRLRDILSAATNQGTPLLETTRAELDRLTGGAVHQGIALQLIDYEYAHPDDLLDQALASDGIVVALDQVTDPRNLGAVIRSAAAFGATGVIIPQRRSAQLTATAWKASAGTAARLPVARATNLTRTLTAFADAGFAILGLAGEGATPLGEVAADGPIVLVVGSEGAGLSRLVRETCTGTVTIPIAADVESLNASVAAGIALYELASRR